MIKLSQDNLRGAEKTIIKSDGRIKYKSGIKKNDGNRALIPTKYFQWSPVRVVVDSRDQ